MQAKFWGRNHEERRAMGEYNWVSEVQHLQVYCIRLNYYGLVSQTGFRLNQD